MSAYEVAAAEPTAEPTAAPEVTPEVTPEVDGRVVDPRAVRVALGPAAAHAGLEPILVEPPLMGGEPGQYRLDRFDAVHMILSEVSGDGTRRTPVSLLPLEIQVGPKSGVAYREVVVGGWRVEVEVESERRASLRERARRSRAGTARAGPTDVRAIIPGRIVSVSIVAGDPVQAGQQLLVIEAMKMQNELRAPRDGVVARVAVGSGTTIEVGDLLLVLE
jgi:biotin carboxyl carrier protein